MNNALDPTRLARCLGEEIRMKLVCLVVAHEEVCVCDLVETLGAPQSTISRHLAQLRDCGVVRARRDGTWMHYALAPDLPDWAYTAIDALVTPAREQLSLSALKKAC